VSLSRTVDGFIGLRHLSDAFVAAEAVGELVAVGSLVVARVLPRKEGLSKQSAPPLSLRRSDVEGGAYVAPEVSLTFGEVHPGMVLAGKVKSITDFGIFVRLDGSTIDALCHKTEVSDRKVGSLSAAFAVGTAVKIAVLRVNAERKTVSGSMRRSRLEELEDEDNEAMNTASRARVNPMDAVAEPDGSGDSDGDDDNDDDEEEGDDEEDDEGDDEGDEEDSGEEDDEEANESGVDSDDIGNEEDGEEEDDDDEEEDEDGGDDPYGEDALGALTDTSATKKLTAPGPGALSMSAPFVWDDFGSTVNQESRQPPSLLDGAVEAAAPGRRGRRAQEAELARHEEAAVAAREADVDSAPRAAEDFERLLLGSPNSSYVWIRYMSFQLNLTEIERARQVGERALRTIELAEHKERFNIHAALLNLEKAHGDEQTLAAAVARALQGCDAKDVYMHVALVHERAGDAPLADAAYEVAAKKFRAHPDVWIAWMSALMIRNAQAAAKTVLQRSVEALPRAKHVEVISKFAQLEFRHGLAERGRTVFDGVLANYPKRVDVWNIYIDMELRQGESEPTRHLFERVTSLRLSSKKMKYFFSRYLTYARGLGDASLVAHVKDKARAWVESAAGGVLE